LQNLSDMSGIIVANLSLIENAKSTPTTLTRIRLEKILGQRIKFVDVADKNIRSLFSILTRTK
jgi:hypothetical protein